MLTNLWGEIPSPHKSALLSGKFIYDTFLKLLRESHFSIRIFAYNFSFPRSKSTSQYFPFIRELINAINRGVSTRIILNRYYPSNKTLINQMVSYNLLTSLGASCKLFSEKKTIHSKLLLIDDKYLLCGSNNLTYNSFFNTLETCCFISCQQPMIDIVKFFDGVWSILK